MSMSVAKGEADGCILSIAAHTRFAEKGLIEPLFIVSAKRHEALPGMPAITELASLSEEQKELLEAFEAMPIGKVFFGPPGMPEDRLKFLREAFEKTMAREDFQEDVAKGTGFWGGYLSGEEVAKEMKTLMEARAIYQKLYNLVERYLP